MRFLSAFIVLALLCQVGCDSRPAKKTASDLDVVSVRFPIPAVRAPFGAWFAAQQKGYYTEEGVKVNLNYGGKTTNPVSMVTGGTDDFGVLGGPDTVLVAIGKGAPLVIIAILHKESNLPCLITLKDSGLERVEQLDGKSVGMYSGHISTDVLRNVFRKSGINVKEVDVGYDYSQFISGRVDAQWAFRTAAAVELPEKGVEVNVINTADSGVVTHGYALFTTRDMVEKQPDLVRAYLKATLRGVVYMAEHPNEVADMVVGEDDTGNLVKWQVRKRIDQYNEVSPTFDPLPPGYMDREMLESTYGRLVEEGVIETPYEIETAYTTKFLKEIHGEKYEADTPEAVASGDK